MEIFELLSVRWIDARLAFRHLLVNQPHAPAMMRHVGMLRHDVPKGRTRQLLAEGSRHGLGEILCHDVRENAHKLSLEKNLPKKKNRKS